MAREISEEERLRRSERMKAVNAAKKEQPIMHEIKPQEPQHQPFRKATYGKRELMAMIERGELVVPNLSAAPAIIYQPEKYNIPETLDRGQQLDVRYNMDGTWTRDWYQRGCVAKYIDSAKSATSTGVRVKFTDTEEGVLAWIVNYGWEQAVLIESDPNKSAPVRLNQMMLTQMSGEDTRQRDGWKFGNQPFASLRAAADAVMDWVDTKERARKAGIIESVIEIVR